MLLHIYSGVGIHAAAGAGAPVEIQDFILISTPEPLSCILVHPLKKTSSYATDLEKLLTIKRYIILATYKRMEFCL